MKRYRGLSVFLIVVFLLWVVPFSAGAAAEFEVEDGVLIKYNGTGQAVTVPSGVYSIGDGAFAGNTQIKSVTIPDDVYYIGNNAFSGCRNLQTVDYTDSIVSVGAHAFDNTAWLGAQSDPYVCINAVLIAYNSTDKEAAVPQGVASIAAYAFANHLDITSVTLPDSVLE